MIEAGWTFIVSPYLEIFEGLLLETLILRAHALMNNRLEILVDFALPLLRLMQLLQHLLFNLFELLNVLIFYIELADSPIQLRLVI